jgi:hypothetical protein
MAEDVVVVAEPPVREPSLPAGGWGNRKELTCCTESEVSDPAACETRTAVLLGDILYGTWHPGGQHRGERPWGVAGRDRRGGNDVAIARPGAQQGNRVRIGADEAQHGR